MDIPALDSAATKPDRPLITTVRVEFHPHLYAS